MYKAIFFDWDDTLGNREVYAYDCYKDVMKPYAEGRDPVTFEAILQDLMIWDEKGDSSKTYILSMLEKTYGIHIEPEAYIEHWNSNLWRFCVPFEDTIDTLEYLSKKYKLGIITNGPSEGQRKKVIQAGCGKYFDVENIIVSGDYDYKKPDGRLFAAACEKLGVKPEESVYVGDMFTRDVLGAFRAGMKPVWIWNWGERKCSIDVDIIHHLSELKEMF